MCKLAVARDRAGARRGFRLPKHVMPNRYEIELEPELGEGTFSGRETIDVTLSKPAARVTLHAVDLNITSAYATNADGTRLIGQVSYSKKNEVAHVAFAGALGKGAWKLCFVFSGTLNDKLKGFYRSTYRLADGREHLMAVTQFEAPHARRAFPCFDEPAMKAVFKVRLIVPSHLTALSNGLRLSEKPVDSKKLVEFADTPRMSTYLLAVVVSELEASETVVVNGSRLRVFAPPGNTGLSSFALRVAAFALDYMERYTGVKYPLSELNMVGVPDFESGAMENWGLLTFRLSLLLVDPRTASIEELRQVAKTVVHEVVHQWLGNYDTMLWWNGTYLNEATATFFENKITDAFMQSLDVFGNVCFETAKALKIDALKSTRPLEFPVLTALDADAMFDTLTYKKGAALLLMLERLIGKEKFQEAIALYVRRFAFSNADTGDFWQAFADVTGLPVPEMMHNWIFERGYPLITVAQHSLPGFIKLSQRRFMYLSDDSASLKLWQVPVCLRLVGTGGERRETVILREREAVFYIGEDTRYLVANTGGSGFFRVQYTSDLLSALLEDAQARLSPIERFNLIDDAYACVLAGTMSTTDYIELVERFRQESDPNVWFAITSGLGSLHHHLEGDELKSFEATVRDLVRPAFSSLTWQSCPGENERTRELRGVLAAALGITGNCSVTQNEARALFASYKADPASVDSNVLPAVVQILAFAGDKAQWEEFFALYQAPATPQDQERWLYALTAFQNGDLLIRTLDRVLDGAVRTQDAPYVVAAVLRNARAGRRAWEYIKANWEQLRQKLSTEGLVTMFAGITGLDEPELEKDVVKFLAENPPPGGDQAIPQFLEQLRIAVACAQRERCKLRAFFAGRAAARAIA